VRTLGAVDVAGLDVLVVSVMLVEPKAVLVDGSLIALKSPPVVGIGFVDPNVSWLVEVVTFVPSTPLSTPLVVEEEVPDLEKPVVLCVGPLSVDVVALLKIEPVVVEAKGRTAGLEIPVAVVSGTWVFQDEGIALNSPRVVEEDEVSGILVE